MRERLPNREHPEAFSNVGKRVRLTNISGVDYRIPANGGLDWCRSVTLRSGCTVIVPHALVATAYDSHRRYPADSWEIAVRNRLIAVTEVKEEV